MNQSGNVRASSPQTSCYGELDCNRNHTWISLEISEHPHLKHQTMAETEIRLELVWKCQSLLTWNFMSRRVRQKRISDLNQSGNFRASSRQTSCHGGLDSNRNQTLISLDMSELPQLNRNQTWISLEMSEPPNKKTSMSWRVRLLPKSDLNQFVHVRASSPQQKSDLNQSGNIRASSPQTSMLWRVIQ